MSTAYFLSLLSNLNSSKLALPLSEKFLVLVMYGTIKTKEIIEIPKTRATAILLPFFSSCPGLGKRVFILPD